MELVQARIVSDDVEGMAGFYAALLGASVTLNEYYVEVPAGAATIGFSKRRFTECEVSPGAQVILDLEVPDVDAEFARIDALGVEWVMTPTTQPWGNRSMILRDPAGALINVFARPWTDADGSNAGACDNGR
jgi:predicted enzyme related to lactoylglutathione lyase